MTALAPLVQGFFTERLVGQRRASSHTIAAYRDTWRLLLGFVSHKTGRAPVELSLEDLDAPMIGAFLQHLEEVRSNSVSTRNARLAALRSFFRYASYSELQCSSVIQRVLAIPQKRTDRLVVEFLTREEIVALLASPDRETRLGRRDHALLQLTVQTGLRVSEVTSLRIADLHLERPLHVRCIGKGRKERTTPLTSQTAKVLKSWLSERCGTEGDPVFPGPGGGSLSRDAIWRLVARHVQEATHRCPCLAGRKITPHTLRHTAAMQLLAAGIDRAVIALWLGHEQVETTQIYFHADLAMKQRALDRTAPPGSPRGRYRPSDKLLAFLDNL